MAGRKIVRRDSDAAFQGFGQKELLFKILVIGDYGVGELDMCVYWWQKEKKWTTKGAEKISAEIRRRYSRRCSKSVGWSVCVFTETCVDINILRVFFRNRIISVLLLHDVILARKRYPSDEWTPVALITYEWRPVDNYMCTNFSKALNMIDLMTYMKFISCR